jgi:hypothetical protein
LGADLPLDVSDNLSGIGLVPASIEIKSGLLELFCGGALKSWRDKRHWASTRLNVLKQRMEKRR